MALNKGYLKSNRTKTGDGVVVVTTHKNFDDLSDIFQ